MWHVIYCVWCHIHYMCDITQCLYLWHHTLYVYDISTLYGITHSVMTTQPLCNFTVTLPDITATVSVSSHPVDQFYQAQCMYDIIATMCMTSYALHVTSHPQFRTSHHLISLFLLFVLKQSCEVSRKGVRKAKFCLPGLPRHPTCCGSRSTLHRWVAVFCNCNNNYKSNNNK